MCFTPTNIIIDIEGVACASPLHSRTKLITIVEDYQYKGFRYKWNGATGALKKVQVLIPKYVHGRTIQTWSTHIRLKFAHSNLPKTPLKV